MNILILIFRFWWPISKHSKIKHMFLSWNNLQLEMDPRLGIVGVDHTYTRYRKSPTDVRLFCETSKAHFANIFPQIIKKSNKLACLFFFYLTYSSVTNRNGHCIKSNPALWVFHVPRIPRVGLSLPSALRLEARRESICGRFSYANRTPPL